MVNVVPAMRAAHRPRNRRLRPSAARRAALVGGGRLGLASSAAAADHCLRLLGDDGLHQPAERAAVLTSALRERGVEADYVGDRDVLASDALAAYDGLILYANIDAITPAQEAARCGIGPSHRGRR